MQSLLREQEKFERAWNDGMQQGGKSKAIEIAKKMVEAKLPIETILKTTGLSIQDI